VPLGKSEPVHQLGAAIAGRGSCLVILDNFEQVARHAEATLGAWLNLAPEARFIVTSREVLGIVGEEVLVLAPLNTDEAMQLFEKRACAADSQWTPSVDDGHELLTLVELLDRLPLAIELAAARIRVMSPKAMRERMGQRFQLLASSGGRRDRQATLQSTLDWSWDLLSAAEQWALAQLSVFEGGFTLDAAGAVVSFVGLDDEHWIANVLQNLVQKSLLRRATANRFDMLRAVQDYARARCMSQTPDSGPCEPSRPSAERRHWQYFAEQAEPLTVGHYDVNLENLFAACRRAAQPDPVSAARLLVVIWSHVKWTGPFEAVLKLAQSIRTSDSASSEQHRVVDETAGEANALLGNRQAAGELLASALRLAVAHEDELAQARIQCELVGLEPEEGSIDSARERLFAALTTAERLDSTAVRMRAMNALARVLMTRSQMREAELWYLRALELATARDDGRWMGGLHGNLGTLHHAQGRLESARCHYEQSLALSQVAGNRQWEGNMRCNYGLLLHELGEEHGSHTELQAALDIARSIGHLRLEATTLCNLGITLDASKQPERALSCYAQAVQTAQRMSSPVFEGQLRGYFAAALARAWHHERSAQCMKRAVELCLTSDDPATHALIASQAALVSVLAGRAEAALAELVEAERWLSVAEADAGAECRRVIGEVRARLGTTDA
jgi:tetratricopeptide (TPR) repeat protein